MALLTPPVQSLLVHVLLAVSGAFNGDGCAVIDGRTAKCKAAGLIVLSMKGGGSIGGGRHKSCRAVSGQPPGGFLEHDVWGHLVVVFDFLATSVDEKIKIYYGRK